MAGVLHTAAERLNASVAGATGQVALPVNEPGAQTPITPTEFLQKLPTEFGELTHLFGGEAQPSTQHAPVPTALEKPAGSVVGKLGGLVPDARNTAAHAVETARKSVPTDRPVSRRIDAAVAKARAALRI